LYKYIYKSDNQSNFLKPALVAINITVMVNTVRNIPRQLSRIPFPGKEL